MTSTAARRIPSNTSDTSLKAPTLPPYTEHAADEAIELTSLTSSSSSSSSTAIHSTATDTSPSSSTVPAYANSIFTPTNQLQIQTPGKACLSLPTPQRPDPIPIFTLTLSGDLDRPLYLSIRPQTRSGSCFLTHGDDETETPLTTTTYRFGPGRPPVVVLGGHSPSKSIDGKGGNEGEGEESFEITGRNIFSRAICFDVGSLGSFGWRYANSKERASAGADSLLVCEVFLPLTNPNPDTNSSSAPHHQHRYSLGAKLGLGNKEQDSSKKKKPSAHRIAQLVRNETFRSPGSSRSSAGNGGRLMLDLRVFDEKIRERVQWLVVTTAVSMLKREVDRRRGQQAATIAAVVS
ncbi:hypothetical protein HD806DRAFT_338631 [Xylariaceae sp. AK1471]|nr:hypothetical protein HD806DRAFT_338631 [Xylariaceae sp. AK1471]